MPNKKSGERHRQLRKAIADAGLLPEQMVVKAEIATLPPEKVAAIAAMTPLEIMYAVMHQRYAAGDNDGALLAAREAAPYVHHKLSSADVRVRSELTGKSEAELMVELAALEAKMQAAETLH